MFRQPPEVRGLRNMKISDFHATVCNLMVLAWFWPQDEVKIAQDEVKMAQDELKMAQDGPRWFKMRSRWLKMLQDWPQGGLKNH